MLAEIKQYLTCTKIRKLVRQNDRTWLIFLQKESHFFGPFPPLMFPRKQYFYEYFYSVSQEKNIANRILIFASFQTQCGGIRQVTLPNSFRVHHKKIQQSVIFAQFQTGIKRVGYLTPKSIVANSVTYLDPLDFKVHQAISRTFAQVRYR